MKRSGQGKSAWPQRQRTRYGDRMQPIVRGLPAAPGRGRGAVRDVRAGLAEVELKFRDHVYSGAVVAPTDASGAEADPATFLCLNGVAQGDGPSEREGRSITQHSIMLRGAVGIGPTTSATYTALEPPTIFIAVVLDTQSNLLQEASEDVFINPSGTAEAAPYPFRAMGYSKRFRVLKTKRITFNGMGQVGITGPVYTQPYQQKPFEMYIKLRGLKSTFTPGTTSGNITTLTDNSIHVIAYANKVDLTPTLLYNSRLRFTG